MKKTALTEALGWYGVAAILIAYAGNSFGFVAADHWLYIVLNITGGIGIVIDALGQKNYQPAVLNTIWAVIGTIALIRLFV
jgi:mannosyltransferase OCH1-like enzyme